MRRYIGFALAGMLSVVIMPLAAQTSGGIESQVTGQAVYEAEVTVPNQTDEARNAGFARAMATVLSRLSGNSAVANQPGVAEELRNAAKYVSGFDYRQDQGTSASGAPSFRTTLVVRFNPEDVDTIAQILRLPVWPQPRPKPVIWLAIDDGSGSGPRLVGSAQSNAARPLMDRATERGFQLGLPAGNAAEQAVVGAIWRKDTAAVSRASARYAPPMQLMGKLSRQGRGWVAEWTFIDNGRVLASQTVNEADPRRAMAAGADIAADALIKRYARAGAADPPGVHRVVFSGVSDMRAYLRLATALEGMSVVRRIIPVRAQDDRLELDLELLSGLSGFNRIVDADGTIHRIEESEAEYGIR